MDYSGQLTLIIELLRAILFWIAFLSGLIFVSLFARRWFF